MTAVVSAVAIGQKRPRENDDIDEQSNPIGVFCFDFDDKYEERRASLLDDKDEEKSTIPTMGAFFQHELSTARGLYDELLQNRWQRWLRDAQGGNCLFLMACNTAVLEQLRLPDLDLTTQIEYCRSASVQLKKWCGIDNRFALIQSLFPSYTDKAVVDQVPDIVGPKQDLADYFNYWAMSIVRPGKRGDVNRDTESILYNMIVDCIDWQIDTNPKAKGFLSAASERALYFCTHVIYFATRYGTQPINAHRTFESTQGLLKQLGIKLLHYFHCVQDPNKEVKMELAACVILCRIPDVSVRHWVKSLTDAFAYTKTGKLKFERCTLLMYRLHSHAVYLNLKAIALKEELEGSIPAIPV